MELSLKLFFGDTRPPVGQLDTGIRLLTPMSRCNQKSLGLYVGFVVRCVCSQLVYFYYFSRFVYLV